MDNKDIEKFMEVFNKGLCEQRKYIINIIDELQGTVSQFVTSKECIAYNRAIKDAAQRVKDLNEARTIEE
jgi:hypothetical protein